MQHMGIWTNFRTFRYKVQSKLRKLRTGLRTLWDPKIRLDENVIFHYGLPQLRGKKGAAQLRLTELRSANAFTHHRFTATNMYTGVEHNNVQIAYCTQRSIRQCTDRQHRGYESG